MINQFERVTVVECDHLPLQVGELYLLPNSRETHEHNAYNACGVSIPTLASVSV
ncbi:hypothetical protein QUB80_05640 [Chlorogloeopsis sp. ULAP01]|uniref:hypothetical protein n=1 Tax=Chlorogloeopsis sp. ULAP01 TaxID=3056483 RepID=UPI0025AB26E4|nr:hypothetical protein [Chlorogloeopsis sp. ULAP01]MDM9380182.1 hypothetical protein [Chlorogloeopsis sp. ULAP01]